MSFTFETHLYLKI